MPSTNTSVAERFTRVDDPETSRAAAAAITVDELTKVQLAIVTILRSGPLTDEQIWEEYNARRYLRRTPQRLRSARDEITEGYRPPRRRNVKHVVVREPRIRMSPLPPVPLASGYPGHLWELIPEDEN